MVKPTFFPKVTRPKQTNILERERLFQLLDLGCKRPLIWVSASAGSGKTTLLNSYIENRKIPCIWYKIDKGDEDLATFFYYLGLAVKKAFPRRRNSLPLFTPEFHAQSSAFTRFFFHELHDMVKKPMALIFDDYQHFPADSEIHNVIRDGLSYLRDNANMFVISRENPPEAFSRIKANGMMSALGWPDLRLSPEEASEMAKLKEIKTSNFDKIIDINDGWAAGISLMLEAITTGEISFEELHNISMDSIFKYFANEIFEKMEKDEQIFLLKIALFPQMTVEAAKELTGNLKSSDILSGFYSKNYFLEKRFSGKIVYQFHALFRDFLLERANTTLSQNELSEFRHKAANLLKKEGFWEDAAELYHCLNNWQNLMALILDNAKKLMGQGRNSILEKWIKRFPQKIIQNSPQLTYWLGVSRMSDDPNKAYFYFNKTFEMFAAQNNDTGILLAWTSIIDSVFYAWNDFKKMDYWLERIWEIYPRSTNFPSNDIKISVTTNIFTALFIRKPDHPDVGKWLERSLNEIQVSRNTDSLLSAYLCGVKIIVYCLWMGDQTRNHRIQEILSAISQYEIISPLIRATSTLIEASTQLIDCFTVHEQPLSVIQNALGTVNSADIHMWDNALLGLGVYCALTGNDFALAEEYLKKMESTLDQSRYHGYCQYYLLYSWYALLCKDIPKAFDKAENALRVGEETGFQFPTTLCRYNMAIILHEKGEYESSMVFLNQVLEFAQNTGSSIFEYMGLAAEAYFFLDRGMEKAGLKSLQTVFLLGRKRNIVKMIWWWYPKMMTMLCIKALVEEIETEYTQKLIRVHGLYPEQSPLDIENWPWPVKISSLGPFSLLKNGKIELFGSKNQRKPLLMLKVLIALGGRNVKKESIIDILWPEAEGDAAHSSFTTTLSRLRKMIGEDIIEIHDGSFHINPKSCWLDIWAFDQMFSDMTAFEKNGFTHKAAELSDRVFRLYQGTFLKEETDQSWAIPLRERFRMKFLNYVLNLGSYWEGEKQIKIAIDCYQRGLEKDSLSEELYQRLMLCYQSIGLHAEAVTTYEFCLKVLSSTLGIKPSSETQRIYRSLL